MCRFLGWHPRQSRDHPYRLQRGKMLGRRLVLRQVRALRAPLPFAPTAERLPPVSFVRIAVSRLVANPK